MMDHVYDDIDMIIDAPTYQDDRPWGNDDYYAESPFDPTCPRCHCDPCWCDVRDARLELHGEFE